MCNRITPVTHILPYIKQLPSNTSELQGLLIVATSEISN